jgi:hypothetical protein
MEPVSRFLRVILPGLFEKDYSSIEDFLGIKECFKTYISVGFT